MGTCFFNGVSVILQYAGVHGGAWTIFVCGIILLCRIVYNRNQYKQFLNDIQTNFKRIADQNSDATFSKTIQEKIVANYQLSVVNGRIVDFVEDCDHNGTSTTRLGDTYHFVQSEACLNIQQLSQENQYSDKAHGYLYFAMVIVFLVLIVIEIAFTN